MPGPKGLGLKNKASTQRGKQKQQQGEAGRRVGRPCKRPWGGNQWTTAARERRVRSRTETNGVDGSACSHGDEEPRQASVKSPRPKGLVLARAGGRVKGVESNLGSNHPARSLTKENYDAPLPPPSKETTARPALDGDNGKTIYAPADEGTARKRPNYEATSAFDRTGADLITAKLSAAQDSRSNWSSFQRRRYRGKSPPAGTNNEGLLPLKETAASLVPDGKGEGIDAPAVEQTAREKPHRGDGAEAFDRAGADLLAAKLPAAQDPSWSDALKYDDSTEGFEFGGGDSGFNLLEERGGLQASSSGERSRLPPGDERTTYVSTSERNAHRKPNSSVEAAALDEPDLNAKAPSLSISSAQKDSNSSWLWERDESPRKLSTVATGRKPQASPLRPTNRPPSCGDEAAALSSAQEDCGSNLLSSFQRCRKLGKSTREELPPPTTGRKPPLPRASSPRPSDGSSLSYPLLAPGLDTQLDASDEGAPGLDTSGEGDRSSPADVGSKGMDDGRAAAAAMALDRAGTNVTAAVISLTQNDGLVSSWSSSQLPAREQLPPVASQSNPPPSPLRLAGLPSSSTPLAPGPGTQLDANDTGEEVEQSSTDEAPTLRPADGLPDVFIASRAPGPNTQLDGNGTGGEGEQSNAGSAGGSEGLPELIRLGADGDRQHHEGNGDADENDVGPRIDTETIFQDVEAEIDAVTARFNLPAEKRNELVDEAYRIVQKITGDIGGNGQGAAMYGEMIKSSCHRAIDYLVEHAGLGPDSCFIDIGCGRAKPNLHVASYGDVRFSYGIELDRCRVFLANSILKVLMKAAQSDPNMKAITNISLQQGDISDALCLDPFTHVWMFDVAFERPLFSKIAKRFNNSTTAQYLISCKKEALIIHECGFDVRLIKHLPTSMTSSGEGHELYIYKRVNKIVGHGGTDEVGGVKCDPLWSRRFGQVNSGAEAVFEQLIGDIEEFCAFDPVKQRDERNRPIYYEAEDWREPGKKKKSAKQPKAKASATKKKTKAKADRKSISVNTQHFPGGSTATTWSCPKCTLVNPMSTKSCEACHFKFRVARK